MEARPESLQGAACVKIETWINPTLHIPEEVTLPCRHFVRFWRKRVQCGDAAK